MGIATRWSNVLRTGSVDARFTAVNFVTLMFTMERGRDILEVSPCNPDQTLNGRYHTSSSFYEMRVQSAEMFVILLSFPPPLPWFQLKEFVLSQAEAYELRIGDQVFRRPGDPPLDQVLRKPRKKKRRKSRDEL